MKAQHLAKVVIIALIATFGISSSLLAHLEVRGNVFVDEGDHDTALDEFCEYYFIQFYDDAYIPSGSTLTLAWPTNVEFRQGVTLTVDGGLKILTDKYGSSGI